MSEETPRPLWIFARAAVERGYEVTIAPRVSACTFIARRSGIEIGARWMRADAAAPWRADGKASVTLPSGDLRWVRFADVIAYLAQHGRSR